ncbi:MAG: hypothetical protein R3B92_01430 [Patescibacteria group bacterium]|uniref:DUF4870 domain-containing protein n=1 Tax=candidate division WWE3 bacterium TaxID=2053526 RepID=A0A955J230_UNCKA|nr:hypothetical protein [candidate division WWE3 bacterium]
METNQTNTINSINPQTKPYEMDPNIEAAMSYLITPITGVVVLVTEKQNKFVRFHAMQSIIFGVSAFAIIKIAKALEIILIGIILGPVANIAIALLWLTLMWKAFNKIEYELPILGRVAKDFAYKNNFQQQ